MERLRYWREHVRRRNYLRTLVRLEEQVDKYYRTLVNPNLRISAIILKKLLEDVRKELIKGKEINTKNTYILPGPIFIVKQLLRRRMSVPDTIMTITKIRSLARKLFRKLVYKHNLEYIIPGNLSTKDIKVYVWVDKVGYTIDGKPLYMLTMYNSFPFDIVEIDQRSEYEPISFLFVRDKKGYRLIKAFARIHYDIYSYDLEGVNELKILFTRSGHTPIILTSKNIERFSQNNKFKELLDKLWLNIGKAATKLLGVAKIKLKEQPGRIHVYMSYKLPRVSNNPFITSIHPFFIDLSL